MTLQHEIDQSDLRKTNWKNLDEAPLGAEMVRLKVDAFALTANNVTYAAFGNAPMHYWNFYPASDPKFGRVPVWGFASVIASNHADVSVGSRVYGYLPISEQFDVQPERASARGFNDGAEHRKGLAPIYSYYTYNKEDSAYLEAYEPQQMLFRPLYMTGWMICDSLMNGDHVPETVIISSASSKTALATAHSLKAKDVRTVGVTSDRNKAYVEKSGLYDQVHTYGEAETLRPDGRAAYVDFVGRPSLTQAIHAACGDTLTRSVVIGVTDWEADRTPPADLIGPIPEFFFVPDYAANRAKSLPPGELDQRVGRDLVSFYEASKTFVTPLQIKGKDAIAKAWLDTVDGNIPPDLGLICSF